MLVIQNIHQSNLWNKVLLHVYQLNLNETSKEYMAGTIHQNKVHVEIQIFF
jgi:hypothetical protein